MFRILMLIVLVLTGCSKSATEQLAEQQLAKRQQALKMCAEYSKAKDMEGLARYMKENAALTENDEDFIPYKIAYMEWENDVFKKSMNLP